MMIELFVSVFKTYNIFDMLLCLLLFHVKMPYIIYSWNVRSMRDILMIMSFLSPCTENIIQNDLSIK